MEGEPMTERNPIIGVDQKAIDAARKALRKDPDTSARSGFGDRVIVEVQRGESRDNQEKET